MALQVLSIALLCLYALAAAMYADALLRGLDKVHQHAKRTLQLALVVHASSILLTVTLNRAFRLDVGFALSAISLLLGATYLLTAWIRPRLSSLGAFIIPVVLILHAASELVRDNVGLDPRVGHPLLAFHVAVNVLGLVAFVLAFAVSVAYLIQETMLRRKSLGALFQRLPDLHVLDNLVLLHVTLGFPLLTLGIITGAMWSYRVHHSWFVLTNGQVFAFLAWGCFAAVLVLRLAVGWRGRRAAIGTMIGFACSMLVVVGYMLRGAGLGP
jgi:ABC-type uncharacterized transport system permease subunit